MAVDEAELADSVDSRPRQSIEPVAVRRMCTSSNDQSPIRVERRVTVADLDLSGLVLERPLHFVDTVFHGAVSLAGVRTRDIHFERCHLHRGLNLNGSVIEGNLDLDRSKILGATTTSASTSRSAGIWLCEAEISGRLLAGGVRVGAQAQAQATDEYAARALQADRLRVGGSIRLINGFSATGEVRFIGADIAGSLDMTSCLIVDPSVALDITEASIGGSLFIIPADGGSTPQLVGRLDMENAQVGGQVHVRSCSIRGSAGPSKGPYYFFDRQTAPLAIRANGARFGGDVWLDQHCDVHGRVEMASAEFAGDLDFGDSALDTRDSYALNLTSAKVAGDLSLPKRTGPIRLASAHVGGSLYFLGVKLTATEQPAVFGRGASVLGDLRLHDSMIDGGEVDLRRIQVRGDISTDNTALSNPDGRSLALAGAEIGGSLYLGDGFRSLGSVRLSRAIVAGRLSCRTGTFIQADPDLPALEADSCQIGSGVILSWHANGIVDLSGLRTPLLDDELADWSCEYRIGGMTYERLNRPVNRPRWTFEQRLAWVQGQLEFDSSSYEQLEAYYRNQGRTLDAERVIIARNRELRRRREELGGLRNGARNLADLVWDIAVGYGFRPGRVGALLFALVALTVIALSLPAGIATMRTTDEDNRVYQAARTTEEPVSCADGAVRCFNPVFYSIDTVVPLVDLHQRSTWYPNPHEPWGQLYSWGLNLAVLLGWATSSLLVLGLTHAVGPGRARR